jgi:hypothetical protein
MRLYSEYSKAEHKVSCRDCRGVPGDVHQVVTVRPVYPCFQVSTQSFPKTAILVRVVQLLLLRTFVIL